MKRISLNHVRFDFASRRSAYTTSPFFSSLKHIYCRIERFPRRIDWKEHRMVIVSTFYGHVQECCFLFQFHRSAVSSFDGTFSCTKTRGFYRKSLQIYLGMRQTLVCLNFLFECFNSVAHISSGLSCRYIPQTIPLTSPAMQTWSLPESQKI